MMRSLLCVFGPLRKFAAEYDTCHGIDNWLVLLEKHSVLKQIPALVFQPLTSSYLPQTLERLIILSWSFKSLKLRTGTCKDLALGV